MIQLIMRIFLFGNAQNHCVFQFECILIICKIINLMITKITISWLCYLFNDLLCFKSPLLKSLINWHILLIINDRDKALNENIMKKYLMKIWFNQEYVGKLQTNKNQNKYRSKQCLNSFTFSIRFQCFPIGIKRAWSKTLSSDRIL
jgi:hypothetical protein